MSIRPVGVAFAAASVLTLGLLSLDMPTPSQPAPVVAAITADQTTLTFDATAVQRAHDHANAVRARQQAAQRRAAQAAAQKARAEREARQQRAQARASRSRTHAVPQVDTGSGLPTELKRIRSCESGPNGYATHGWAFDYDYNATNPASSASGAYQFLDGTWRSASGLSGRAKDYSREVQDRVALSYYRANGGTPWNASRSCWGR